MSNQPTALYLAQVLQSADEPVSDAAAAELRRLHAMTERTLNDEIIAELWHKNGGYHHHFARAIERYLKGQA